MTLKKVKEIALLVSQVGNSPALSLWLFVSWQSEYTVFTLLPGWWKVIIVAVGFVALLIIAIAVIRWKKAKGKSILRRNCLINL